LSKFIANSSHIYNYFGYKHVLYFWDKQLVSFYRDLPFNYKLGKKLYDEVLINEFFNKFSLNFQSEIQPSKRDIIFQNIKNYIKTLLPEFVKIKLRNRKDWLNSEITISILTKNDNFTRKLLKETAAEFNYRTIRWFIEKLKKL